MLHYAITAVPERHQWHISLTYRREEKSSLHLHKSLCRLL